MKDLVLYECECQRKVWTVAGSKVYCPKCRKWISNTTNTNTNTNTNNKAVG